jgi:hypothetical protein
MIIYDSDINTISTDNVILNIDGDLVVKRNGSNNDAFGLNTLKSVTIGTQNTAIGNHSLYSNTDGNSNIGVGSFSLFSNQNGSYNLCIGNSAGMNILSNFNTALGAGVCMDKTSSGDSNTAVGYGALTTNTIGSSNTAVGVGALADNLSGSFNTAIGQWALLGLVGFSNCVGVGFYSEVTNNNQIQLGDSSTTTYVYGTVQNRSDLRDKKDIRDTVLGLDFINNLRPVDFKWDYRESYVDLVETIDISGNKSVSKVEVPKDGSRARNRFHHGLIAQEVKDVMEDMGVDFGGYQDHSFTGGKDVLTIGYDELIAPLIKAIQELKTQNDQLSARITALGG